MKTSLQSAFRPILTALCMAALVSGCSQPRDEAYFADSANKKERNYVLQQCREKAGKLSGKEETECANAQKAYDAESAKKPAPPAATQK